MSDEVTPPPAESPSPEAPQPAQQQPQQQKKGVSRALIIGLLIGVILFVIIALLLLRGCTGPGSSSSSSEGSQTTTSTASESSLAIENRVYAALRGKTLAKGVPLDNYVYIARASTDGTVAVVVTLTAPRNVLARNAATNPKKVATDVENAVLIGVPQVQIIAVVDADNALISSKKRGAATAP